MIFPTVGKKICVTPPVVSLPGNIRPRGAETNQLYHWCEGQSTVALVKLLYQAFARILRNENKIEEAINQLC